MTIKSQIAAARALAPRDMIRTVRALQHIAPNKHMVELCDALERACELLEKHACGSRESVHGYNYPRCDEVRAFLAGEVK